MVKAARSALLLVVALLSVGWTGTRGGIGNCPPVLDFGLSLWGDDPAENSCDATTCQGNSTATYQHWTREDAALCDGCVFEVGGDEQDFDLPSTHSIPGLTSSGFDLHWSSSNMPMDLDRILTIIADIRARVPAGRRGPSFVLSMRWDLATAWEMDLLGAYAPQASWFLRTDRSFSTFAGWFNGAGGEADAARCGADGEGCQWSKCRSPASTFQLDERWNAAQGGSHCNKTWSGSWNTDGEWGIRSWDLAEAISPGLGDAIVYHIAPGDGLTFRPTGVLMNLRESSYQDAMVSLCSYVISRGFDGCVYPHKRHQFWWTGGATEADRQISFWPDIGDGRGGLEDVGNFASHLTGTMDTLAEIVAEGAVFSGPPEIPNGVAGCATGGGCAYDWGQYSLGMLETARKNDTAGNTTMRVLDPALYEGCPKAKADWDSAYDDAACDNAHDDADGAVSETASEREIIARTEWVFINLGGKQLNAPDIGPGNPASGWSFDELRTLLLDPPTGAESPSFVSWYGLGSNPDTGTTPKLCGNPSATNPTSPRLGTGPTAQIVAHCSAKTGTTLASPAFCSFDATGTTHLDEDVAPIHHLRFSFDYGDGTSGSWSYGNGESRNADQNAVGSHRYDCNQAQCLYTASVTAIDQNGTSSTASVGVVVQGESTAWSDTDTKCVCYDGAGTGCQNATNGFEGCPLDNDADGDCTSVGENSAGCVESQDFDASLLTSAGKRTLYRSGDTFVANAAPAIANAASNGSLIGCYGASCDTTRPEVLLEADLAFLDGVNLSGWRIDRLRFDGAGLTHDYDGLPSVATKSADTGSSDILISRSEFLNVGSCPYVTMGFGSAEYNDRVAMIDSRCTLIDGAAGNWNLGLWSVRYGAYTGNLLESLMTVGGYTGWRGMGQDTMQFAHNRIRMTGPLAGGVQFRSCSGRTSGGTPGCPQRDDRRVVIEDNEIFDDGTESSQGLYLVNSHDLVDPGQSAAKRDYVVDRNVFRYGSTQSRSGYQAVIRADGVQGLTVRNTVVDTRGLPDLPNVTTRFFSWGNNVSGGPHGPSWVVNNSGISSDASSGHAFTICDATGATLTGTNACLSNVWWDELRSSGIALSAGTWTQVSDNERLYKAAESPFAGALGDGVLSAATELWSPLEARIRASGGGRARVYNEGYAYPSLNLVGSSLRDFALGRRGSATGGPDSLLDIGAFEYGATH